MSKVYDKYIHKVDRETGEIVSTILRTEEQDRGWIRKQQNAALLFAKDRYKHKQAAELGNFIWLLYNINKAFDLGLKQSDLTRIIFLSTYMNYDNLIVDSDGLPLKKNNVNTLLKLEPKTFSRFFKSVSDSGILMSDTSTGYLKLNSQVFAKGNLTRVITDKNAIRLYIQGIQHLYEKSQSKGHKTLAYVFQAIPYLNIEYNLLCHNPKEKILKNVETMDFADYCKCIGYDVTNASRLKSVLRNIRVGREGVFGFVDTADGEYVFINPRVFYAGSQHELVMMYGKFYEEQEKEGEAKNNVR